MSGVKIWKKNFLFSLFFSSEAFSRVYVDIESTWSSFIAFCWWCKAHHLLLCAGLWREWIAYMDMQCDIESDQWLFIVSFILRIHEMVIKFNGFPSDSSYPSVYARKVLRKLTHISPSPAFAATQIKETINKNMKVSFNMIFFFVRQALTQDPRWLYKVW